MTLSTTQRLWLVRMLDGQFPPERTGAGLVKLGLAFPTLNGHRLTRLGVTMAEKVKAGQI